MDDQRFKGCNNYFRLKYSKERKGKMTFYFYLKLWPKNYNLNKPFSEIF